MNQLDIVRSHKASFVGRFDTPQFLAEMTDAVISHQWENALNYFYLEVCWQGYPLIHNAYLCDDIGYYYKGNDVQEGSRMLQHALERHDDDAYEYLLRQRGAIARFLPSHPAVTSEYARLIQDLLSRDIR
jgi:hypothetical protein